MRTEIENNLLIAYLTGKIDSSNAKQTEKELENLMADNPGLELTADAGALDYISSAGLRMLMQITRDLGHPLTVRNVSPEIYAIMEMTGFTTILHVQKRMRELSVEGCRIVGRGAIGTVYRLDEDTIVKVFNKSESLSAIENEQRKTKQAFLRGIPTAISYDIVKVGDRYGAVFEMLKASTYNDILIAHPERTDEIVRRYARFIRRLHTVEMEKDTLPEAKDIYKEYIGELRGLLGDELCGRLRGLLEAMPEDLHTVHGDIQMKNIMLSGEEPQLIDMDTLSVGDPVFDLAGVYTTYVLFGETEPGNAERFLGISRETCEYIWNKTVEYYFEGLNGEEREVQVRKIRLAGSVRFLYLIACLNIGVAEFRQPRIDYVLPQLKELAEQVGSLAVRQTE